MSDPAAVSGRYEPDPEGEVEILLEAFFASLAARYPDEPNLVERLRQRQERLLAAQQARVIDEASRHNLAMTLAVLAAYQEHLQRTDKIKRLKPRNHDNTTNRGEPKRAMPPL